MAIGNTLNNPGDLETTSSTAIIYPDQSGVDTVNTSSGVINYATFSNPTDGTEALADYIQRHIASGWTTVQQFVYGFLGTSTNNAANPHVQNYLNAVVSGSGLAANTQLSSTNVNQIAALVNGIIKGEGTSTSEFSPAVVSAGVQEATGAAPLTQAQSDLGGAFSTLYGDFNTGASYAINNPIGAAEILIGNTAQNFSTVANATPAQIASAAGTIVGSQQLAVNTVGQAATDTVGQAVTQAGKQVSGAISGVGGAITSVGGAINTFTSLFSASNLSRGTFLIVGIILLIGAIVFFFADEISEAIKSHPEALAAVA